MGRFDLTGEQLSFHVRDWAAERTRFPREGAGGFVLEKAEAAYRRGDLFDKRA